MKRVLLACLLGSLPLLGGKSFFDIGSDRQLFLDRQLIDEMRGAEFELHRPVLREEVLRYDKPWEGDTSWHPIVIRDGERFRMWYRVSAGNHDGVAQTAYAESRDGIRWERPSLGLVESKGSTDNNLIWPTPGNQGINMCVFKDPNPGVPEGERYKAIVQTRDIHGLVSADGLRWNPIQPDPLIRRLQDQVNDGPHAAFWDPWQSRYVIYKRGWWGATPEKQLDASGTSGEANRTIRRFTSRDFLTWDGPEWVEIPFGTHPREQFYTSAAIPYPWARNVYLMFPMRFILDREGEGWPFPGLSDIALLSSRDGLHWQRTFREAWIRPGLDRNNWHERAMSFGSGLVRTAPGELSMYMTHNYRTPDAHIRRVTLRQDGFISVHAPDLGGEFTTRPLKFKGSRLRINYSTSVTGSVRVEVLNHFSRPVLGFNLKDSSEIYGDELDRIVRWGENEDLSALEGQTVRLRFVLRDANLYSFQFGAP